MTDRDEGRIQRDEWDELLDEDVDYADRLDNWADRIGRTPGEIERLRKGWQPIETVPKDGTDLLLYSPRWGMMVGLWAGAWVQEEGGPSYRGITHWMPLPDPPQETDG